MLPLSAEATPTTIAELKDAIGRGFLEQEVTPRAINAEGDTLSHLTTLSIDLTGAQATRNVRPPRAGAGSGQDLEIGQFELTAVPIYFEKAPLEIRLSAEGVKATMEVSDGHGAMIVKSASSGDVSVEAARETLEKFLHSLAVEAAAKQGLEVRKTNLNFTQEGPRAVSFRAEVTAKVFLMTASLALTGRLAIDDELNAQISKLALDGDGMILKLAGSFARPHLDRLEGRVFPLLAFTPAGLRLRDVELNAGSSLRVHAQFGTA